MYHPRTDEQSKRTIQTIEDMLRACSLDFKRNCDDHLSLVEFAYNNGYRSSIRMAPYEAIYSRKYRPPLYWDEVGGVKILGPELAQHIKQLIEMIQFKINKRDMQI